MNMYQKQSEGVKNMFNRLANDKFANTVDIQDLLLKKSKQLYKLRVGVAIIQMSSFCNRMSLTGYI